ncbi:hypothetical protein [Azospirillum thermophilum]|uniref:Uncharacterized protein n=1 Tax=Azospirillum thermophilum TaxID=2202148 RepID=A0A2S2D0R2_9PROT|nr:hypothetical protein [Azospirillum thermophilum]AWK90351.1 hypothetical protein DEW08_30525 [Azospirillum thermophilum]
MSRNVSKLIHRRGRPVVLRRQVGGPTPFITVVVKGLSRAFGVHELAGNIVQGDHQVIVLAADLAAAGWPLPVLHGDTVVLDPEFDGAGGWQRGTGRSLTIQDPGPRAGLFWIQARG